MKNINNFENFTGGAIGVDGISDQSLTGIEVTKESANFDESGRIIITVKDIIDFLSKYDGNTQVHLDKDGWEGANSDEAISYLFDTWSIEKYGITVNN